MLGNKYVAAVIGVLVILVIAYNIKFFSSKIKHAEVSTIGIPVPLKYSEHKPVRIYVRIFEKEDKNPWKRDPFALKAATVKTEYDIKGIHLMGIIKRDGESHALINGGVYGVNDTIGNAVIKEIKKHSIVLLSNGKTREVSFEDYIVLKENKK